jgi:hypothetical protein
MVRALPALCKCLCNLAESRHRRRLRHLEEPSSPRRRFPSITGQRPVNLFPTSRYHPRWAVAAVNDRRLRGSPRLCPPGWWGVVRLREDRGFRNQFRRP